MKGVQVEIKGDRQLLARLDRLKKSTQNRVMRPAVAAAARIVRKEVKKNAPHTPSGSGNLKASIDSKVKTGRRAVFAVIGPRSGVAGTRKDLFGRIVKERPALIAHLVEGGARPHVVKIGRGHKVIWMHPGAPAVRFISRAAESTAAQARGVMERKIAEGLEKHA